MVTDHSESERRNPLPPLHGLFFSTASKIYFICTILQTGQHTPWICYTSCGALVGMRNSSMRDQCDEPSHYEQMLCHISLLTARERDVASSVVRPLSYFSFQPVLHDWCTKGHHGMCYSVCGMVHIKEPLLLLIGKSSPCGRSGFPLAIWVVLSPYVRCHITVNKMCWVHR